VVFSQGLVARVISKGFKIEKALFGYIIEIGCNIHKLVIAVEGMYATSNPFCFFIQFPKQFIYLSFIVTAVKYISDLDDNRSVPNPVIVFVNHATQTQNVPRCLQISMQIPNGYDPFSKPEMEWFPRGSGDWRIVVRFRLHFLFLVFEQGIATKQGSAYHKNRYNSIVHSSHTLLYMIEQRI
jgi:hypothetical protein